MFVQTDKSIYKPGDKVQFRVIVLDSDTRPYPAEDIKIFITDSANNRIKQYANITLTKGVYQNDLQLPDLAIFGDWRINVEIENEKSYKVFEVAEYVLPKFKVKIETKSHVTFKEENIRVTVGAKYTYGKSVKGQATITAKVGSSIRSTMVIPVDTKETVDLNMKDELKLSGPAETTLTIHVDFKEELTGRVQNASTEIHVHEFSTKIQIKKLADQFKPGLVFPFQVIVTRHDGAPVIGENNQVEVEIGEKVTSYCLDKNGIAEIDENVPENAREMKIKVSFIISLICVFG